MRRVFPQLGQVTTLPLRCSCPAQWAAIAEAAAALPRPTLSPPNRRQDWSYRRSSSTNTPLQIREPQDVLELNDASFQVRRNMGTSTPDHHKPRGALSRPIQLHPILDSTDRRTNTPVVTPSQYGRWESLLFDFEQLENVSSFGLPSLEARRLSDRPDHGGDIGLWSAIFNFCHRRRDRDGALVVWKEIFRRKRLHKTNGAVANAFWQAVVDAAVDDEAFLESTWAYAEWMQELHSTEWPRFYQTIVSFCLENGQLDRALRWHIRLSPHFDPGRKIFFDILKAFISNPDQDLQDTLRAIYTTSKHRQLYDSIVALLWSQGNSYLARSWRRTLLLQNDMPTSPMVRPFLKFMLGYFQESQLTEEEIAIASTLSQPLHHVEVDNSRDSTSTFLMMDRIRNETLGFRERKYNDKLGSRWFASTWVSLDTAIRLIAALGVEEIGPLSLQSIALREQSSAGLLRRFKQLEELHIRTGGSNYAKAIRYLSQVDHYDTLQDLLRSDLHPEVYDDAALLSRIMRDSSIQGDWTTYRLILAVRLALSADTMANTSNSLLTTCLEQDRKQLTLKVLDEIKTRHIEVSPSTSNDISHLILRNIPSRLDVNAVPAVDFYVALSRRIAALHYPVAAQAWQRILLLFSQQGRLDDLEQLSLDILHRYLAWHDSDRPAMNVHISDVPDVSLGSAPYSYYLLPRDLPVSHERHPVQLVFNSEFADEAVRNSFNWEVLRRHSHQGRSPGGEMQPAAYGFGRGLRLLGILRDNGIHIDASRIRESAIICLTELFGPLLEIRPQDQAVRLLNQLTVSEVKQVMDDAWGSELLPATDELEVAWEHLKASTAEVARDPGGLWWRQRRFRTALFNRLNRSDCEV